jgi:hypothetical protein
MATAALDYKWMIVPGTEVRGSDVQRGPEVGVELADFDHHSTERQLHERAVTRASHAIEYRHAPVVGFGRSDMRTAVTLVCSMAMRPRAE